MLVLFWLGATIPAWCQSGTGTYVSQQYYNVPGGTVYYLIATLPASNDGTFDHLHLVATLNGDWFSIANSTIDVTFGNRGGFNYYYTVVGKPALGGHAHLVAYQQADSSVNIYLSLADSYDVGSYAVINGIQEMVNQAASEPQNATPPGTLIFDTASASYPPVSYTDPSGDITANGAISAASISFPNGTTMSSAPPASLTSSNGNVGIGTTNPSDTFDVNGNAGIQNGNVLLLYGPSNAYSNALYTDSSQNLHVAGRNGGTLDLDTASQIYFNTLAGGTFYTKMTLLDNGNLGIGTQNPISLVELYGGSDQITTALADSGSRSSNLALNAADVSYGAGSAITFGNVQSVAAGSIGWASIKSFLTDGAGNTYGDLAFSTRNSRTDTSLTERLRIAANGNIGIGIASPGAKLEVDGNVKLTSGSGGSITFADGTVQTTAYAGTSCPIAELVMPDKTIVAQGGDYAESVDVNGDRASYEPGDVMVIDPANPEHFLKSSKPYSTLVAGIYSTKPGYVGRRQPGDPKIAKTEIPMAMIGIVPTKVTAENGSISVGDLLVTSSISGYAMKGTDRSIMSGAIVGKALGRLDSGTGTVEVLVSLQ